MNKRTWAFLKHLLQSHNVYLLDNCKGMRDNLKMCLVMHISFGDCLQSQQHTGHLKIAKSLLDEYEDDDAAGYRIIYLQKVEDVLPCNLLWK